MSAASEANLDLARVARQVGATLPQVEQVVALLDAGNTTAFITRFRRDQTGGLDEPQIARIASRLGKLKQFAERKRTILRSIAAQGKLTPDLAAQIESADSPKRLEDIHFPYRPHQRQALAAQARRRGLEPLAAEILAADPACAERERRAADFADPKHEVAAAEDALVGAAHILADRFSHRTDLRQMLRRTFRRTARLVSKKDAASAKQSKPFADYLDFCQPVQAVPAHRVLAINRGERAKVLGVKVEADIGAMEQEAVALLVPPDHAHGDFLRACVRDALVRLVIPSLERELRRDMTERAEAQALKVFARSLRTLLLQPPLRARRLLAVDPGLNRGCKLAALDRHGEVLQLGLVHTVGSEQRKHESGTRLVEMITAHDLSVVAIGNGTGCREFAELLAELMDGALAGREIAYAVVNEAGASVYSTSALGRLELPDCDATQRSAISIGRRVQDPLSELVKIAPANIGIGTYQHDVQGKNLREALSAVVESCVNFVGVDLNTASPSLLRYVSGLNQLTARRLFDYRNEHGPFASREQLRQVSGISAATFAQAAGFLKIVGGGNPLDATRIHPESYAVAEKVLEKLGFGTDALRDTSATHELARQAAAVDAAALARDLDVGALLLKDILSALAHPGRDPRDAYPAVMLHKGVVKLDDLSEGMELTGSVLNVVDFGAFVDIGLADSGLVHVSQLASRYVRSPDEVVAVGQRVRVWVTAIDKDRRRVALTMIKPGTERRPKPKKGTAEPSGRRGGGGAPASPPAGRRSARAEPKTRRRKPAGQPPKVRRRPPPVAPISKAVEEGREPMRTFGELLQFHRKKMGASDDDHKDNRKGREAEQDETASC